MLFGRGMRLLSDSNRRWHCIAWLQTVCDGALLWAMENERIDRAKRKKINAFPVKGEILSDCLICGEATPKCKVQRRLIRRYRCDACCREYIVRRPMQ